MRIVLRPTIPQDLASCVFEPLPHRIKAISAVAGDRVLGIGGIGFRPDGTVVAFAQITPELRQYPVALHRAGVAGMRLIRESGLPLIVAEADPNNPAAERWLLHFGFRKIKVGAREAFAWRRENEVGR